MSPGAELYLQGWDVLSALDAPAMPTSILARRVGAHGPGLHAALVALDIGGLVDYDRGGRRVTVLEGDDRPAGWEATWAKACATLGGEVVHPTVD